MDKYTVIIPTLWKSDRTKKLINDLNQCQYVDEIIIIDNSLSHRFDETKDKIRTFSLGENIYVNPAWNLGIKLAKNECIALCNDDINFDPNIFGGISANFLFKFGIIGMGEGNYKDEIDEKTGPYVNIWKRGMNDWGWGCFIILHKKYWVDIPDNIKIWYGDNFIKDINPYPKAILRNFKIETEMSTTSDEKQWDDRKQQDQINFLKLFANG